MVTKLDRSIPSEFYRLLDTAAGQDLRIGQLFESLRTLSPQLCGSDLFYLENDELVRLMRKYITTRREVIDVADNIVTVPHTIDVPKESKEVVDFLAAVVEDIKAGKSAQEIAGENLPGLLAAFEGYAQLPEEVKGEYMSEVLAYLVDKMGDALGK